MEKQLSKIRAQPEIVIGACTVGTGTGPGGYADVDHDQLAGLGDEPRSATKQKLWK